MDCGPPGSSVHGILQARIMEWVVAGPLGTPLGLAQRKRASPRGLRDPKASPVKTPRADGRSGSDRQTGPAPELPEPPSNRSAVTALPEVACSLPRPPQARCWAGSRVHSPRLMEETGAQTSTTRHAWAEDGRMRGQDGCWGQRLGRSWAPGRAGQGGRVEGQSWTWWQCQGSATPLALVGELQAGLSLGPGVRGPRPLCTALRRGTQARPWHPGPTSRHRTVCQVCPCSTTASVGVALGPK